MEGAALLPGIGRDGFSQPLRAVVQRVSRARVTVAGSEVAAIERGYLVLLGVTHDDTVETTERMAARVAGLRLFEDEAGQMNVGLDAVSGAVLCVSQFTLYGDVRRGRRPSFGAAAPREVAVVLYERFCEAIEREGIVCRRGAFGEEMEVELVNAGPVTLIIDSSDLERPRRA